MLFYRPLFCSPRNFFIKIPHAFPSSPCYVHFHPVGIFRFYCRNNTRAPIESRRPFLCSKYHRSITSSISGLNTFLRTLFSNAALCCFKTRHHHTKEVATLRLRSSRVCHREIGLVGSRPAVYTACHPLSSCSPPWEPDILQLTFLYA
jgi:hypothetical protein